MTKPEFNIGDRVSWKYGVGKGTGHIVEKLTKATKLQGKNFKATPEEPKYRIKSDKAGKELVRNPETLELLQDSAGAEKEGQEKEEKDEEIEDVEGDEKEDEGVEISKEREVGGEPLQQMPGSEMKNDMISGQSIPYLEKADDDASLSKIEAHYEPGHKPHEVAGRDGGKDVEMEDARGDANGSTKDVPHGLPHEEVPQPDLDAVN